MNYDLEIENLIQQYDKNNPNYPFTHIFYNLSYNRIRPFSFPIDLWTSSIVKAPSEFHMPVILKGFDELDDRLKKQNEILNSINESESSLNKRVCDLNIRLGILKGKMKDVVRKCRGNFKINGEFDNLDELRERLFKVKASFKRKKEGYLDDKEKVEEVLWILKNVGENLKKNCEKEFGFVN
ncbi:hypothetical protein GVAV_001783 [Gurleya vavrai]